MKKYDEEDDKRAPNSIPKSYQGASNCNYVNKDWYDNKTPAQTTSHNNAYDNIIKEQKEERADRVLNAVEGGIYNAAKKATLDSPKAKFSPKQIFQSFAFGAVTADLSYDSRKNSDSSNKNKDENELKKN
jgi:hypothetical protein